MFKGQPDKKIPRPFVPQHPREQIIDFFCFMITCGAGSLSVSLDNQGKTIKEDRYHGQSRSAGAAVSPTQAELQLLLIREQ